MQRSFLDIAERVSVWTIVALVVLALAVAAMPGADAAGIVRVLLGGASVGDS